MKNNDNHSMIVRADARAMSATTALTVRHSPTWKASDADKRTFKGKKFTGTSACISYFNADKSDARVFSAAQSRKENAKRNTPTTQYVAPLISRLAPIGNVE